MAVSNGFLCSYLSSKLKLYYHDRIPLTVKSVLKECFHTIPVIVDNKLGEIKGIVSCLDTIRVAFLFAVCT